MIVRRSARLSDAALWTATALLLAGGSALGWRVAASGGPGPATTVPSQSPETPAVRAAAAPAGADVDLQLFHARMQAFAPLEAVLRHAFATPRAVVMRLARGPSRGATVTAGTTPEACLAQAVYYEARGEPAAGQAAVAQVVLNRAHSRSHPASVCGVVFEGARRRGCQFSFACDPRLGGRRPAGAAWRRAEEVAAAALAGAEAPELRHALNYHADYVRPGWAGRLQRTAEIGRHIFYAAVSPPAYASDD